MSSENYNTCCLEVTSSKRKSKNLFTNCFQRPSAFLFIMVWSHQWTTVSGGICWLSVDEHGTCRDLMEVGVSREDCCSRDHPTVGWTAHDDYSSSTLFRLAYLGDGVPDCHTCHQTCNNIHCVGDKKCRVRNGQARCMCAPDCGGHTSGQRGPVCGTDGNTYRSYCSLLKSNCRRNRQTQVDYHGRCRYTCDRVHCGDGQSCVTDQNGIPHCIPCDVTKRCPAARSPRQKICGADGVTYPTACDFSKATCRNGHSIGIAYRGECDKSLTCANITCPSGQECLWNSQSRTPQCVKCHRDCHSWTGQNTVCGSDGVTYETWCHLQTHACNTHTVIQTKHYGACDSPPSEHSIDYESAQGDDAYYYAD